MNPPPRLRSRLRAFVAQPVAKPRRLGTARPAEQVTDAVSDVAPPVTDPPVGAVEEPVNDVPAPVDVVFWSAIVIQRLIFPTW